MSNSNNLQAGAQQKPKFSVAITTPAYQKLINNTLSDPKRASRFVANITSAVAVNKDLQDCDAGSILSAALLGESLNLSPSPQLGQFYMVPFNDRKRGTRNAQFILGYKGYMQLAMRSGQLKKINVVAIKQGELKSFDPLNEEIKVELIKDFDERETAETIGYYAFFELINGFRKAMYWSKEQMMYHADKYSPAFSRQGYIKLQNGEIPDRDLWKYSSFWYKNFDDMAKKTMIRQLISKGGCPMSTEMIMAYTRDNSVIEVNQDNEFITVDGEDVQQQNGDKKEAEESPQDEYTPDEIEPTEVPFVEDGQVDMATL